jgi:hypothetical protein
MEDGPCRTCLQDLYSPCASSNKYSDALTGAFSNCLCGTDSQKSAADCRADACSDTIGSLYVDTMYNSWCLNSNTAFRKQICALEGKDFEFFLTNAGPALTTGCEALENEDGGDGDTPTSPDDVPAPGSGGEDMGGSGAEAGDDDDSAAVALMASGVGAMAGVMGSVVAIWLAA